MLGLGEYGDVSTAVGLLDAGRIRVSSRHIDDSSGAHYLPGLILEYNGGRTREV